ncbi:MAG: SpoIIE family protein phosphatase [Pseudolabrys sp.]|nr:SpoIIE family protein phosphatase [Pseudolabrys sp.]
MTLSGARILVVDDVADNRTLLIRRLQRLGFSEFEQAENGVQAVAAIAAGTFDLVLLDIMMPEKDGFGVLETLKRDRRNDDLPVIVVSAKNETDAVIRCIELGAEDFLSKPINPTLLRARVMAVLEKKQLRDRVRADLARKQHELDEAHALQMSLLPPRFDGAFAGRPLHVDVMLEPAKEVGGDLVDTFAIGDNLLVLALGDVSDKGAAAALMMARTHATLRALAERPDAADLFSKPEQAVSALNRALAKGNTSCMFVTFWLGALDLTSGQLTAIRAGQIPPYLCRSAGMTRLAGLSGPPLGLDADAVYAPDSAVLAPGDRLLVLTDGFTEAMNGDGEQFGDARVGKLAAAFDTADALGRLRAEVRAFENGRPPSDDMAALLLTLELAAMPTLEAELLSTSEAIGELTDRIFAFLKSHGVDQRATHHVAMIIDEVVTNLGEHGNCRDKPAHIRVTVEPAQVRGEIRDTGPSFDPRQAPVPDVNAALEDRNIGGLGLHFIRELASSLDYVRDGGQNVMTFTIARAAA